MPGLDDNESWYALRTFYAQEFKVSQYLQLCHLGHFIPMVLRSWQKADGTLVKGKLPAVHNLIFIRKDRPKAEIRALLAACPYPVSVYHHIDNEDHWYEISNNDLMDLRMLCDDVFHPKFISQEESEIKAGTEVYVKCGPFKGMTGKMIRKNKKYYLVKTFVGLGVIVNVSRWCCEPLREGGNK